MAHMLASRSWAVSPTTLSVVTALGSILAAIAGVWVLLIAGPRYRLRYGPLASKQLQEDLWEVAIYLSSRGRLDITRDAFDQDQPVELDIGVAIRDPVDVWSSQESMRRLPHQVEGTRLLVGPGLIGRRQDLCFTVQAAAKPPGHLTCRASLINVRIRRQFLTPQRRLVLFVFAAAAASLVIGAVAYKVLARTAGVHVAPWAAALIYAIFPPVVLGWAWRSPRFRIPDNPADPAKGRAAVSTTPTGTPAPRMRPSDAPRPPGPGAAP